MTDIFDNTILCNKCEKKMEKGSLSRNGFVLRTMGCEKCGEKIVHPTDEQEYHRFINLKNKEFKVKMRLVGNSYAVSIPKEIVSFIQEQERIMDKMVRLCFEDFGRLSLNFGDQNKKPSGSPRVISSKEYRVVKNNKPVFHVKEFTGTLPSEGKNNKLGYFKL